jgi:hypothetical protein
MLFLMRCGFWLTIVAPGFAIASSVVRAGFHTTPAGQMHRGIIFGGADWLRHILSIIYLGGLFTYTQVAGF